MELISKAMKCLDNGDKGCVTRFIEELIRNQCHNGYVVGKEVMGKVKDVVHELWLVSDNELICELLSMLKSLGMSKNWVREALGMNTKNLNKRLAKCGIDWESKVTRNDIVKVIEGLLRERFGWSETEMCKEMFRFIGIDVNDFRKYGIEPCIWLKGLEKLSNLRNPYWLGLKASDLAVEEYDGGIRLELKTSNSVDVVFFLKILSMIKTPSLKIKRERGAPGVKYVHKPINLLYYVDLSANVWPWSIKLNANELKKILNGFSDKGLAEFIAGEIDGDGSVQYEGAVYVGITACKSCPKKAIDVLKRIIARRFGIVGRIEPRETVDVLAFYGENAVKLLRRIVEYVHHPLKRLRAELILALYDGRISPEEFERLYEMTKYERGASDVKRNNALEALARAAPQTHTHGVKNNFPNPNREI
ncbi:MAG: LAGLIDADG family homing endonuclease [Vulcanisaeta sp.]